MSITGSGEAYYIQALLFGHSWTGTVEQGTTISFSYYLEDWDTDPITWDFDSTQYVYDSNNANLTEFEIADITYLSTGDQREYLTDAFNLWAQVADLTITGSHDDAAEILIRKGTTSGASNQATPWYLDNSEYKPIGSSTVPGTLQAAENEIHYADVIFNSSVIAVSTPGRSGFKTFLHEIGHVLGLKHPFDQGGNGNPTLPSSENSYTATVMSYNTTVDGGVVSDVLPVTPMIYDIAAIQYLYGPNSTHNASNTTYSLDGSHSTGGATFSLAETAYDYIGETIWDAGGTDTIVVTSSDDAVLDLREGLEYVTIVGNTKAWVAFGANIEHATGGSGNDSITGNELVNSLTGGLGDDTLTGGIGNDVLRGGTGNDLYVYTSGDGTDTIYDDTTGTIVFDGQTLSGNTFEETGQGTGIFEKTIGGVTFRITGGSAYIERVGVTGKIVIPEFASGDFGITLEEDTTSGGDANDVVYGDAPDPEDPEEEPVARHDYISGGAGNDALYGFAYNDTLVGGKGNDTLRGGNDNDELYGGIGNDILYGEAGDDSISTGSGTDFVYAGNGNDYVTNGEGNDYLNGEDGNDTLIATLGNDSVYGGNGNDSLAGGEGNDYLYDGTGNDILSGEVGNDSIYVSAGADSVNGGDGTDRVHYQSTTGFQLNFITGVHTGDAQGDIFVNVEEIYLGTGNDTVLGGATNDIFYGLNGDDSIEGGDGNDFIQDNYGSNTLSGGGGDDQIHASYADSNLISGGSGNDFLVGSASGNDTLSGDDGNDSLLSDNGNNSLNGGDGNDNLSVGSGNDTLSGGNGNDTLYGSAGVDVVDGGSGNDVLDYVASLTAVYVNLEINSVSGGYAEGDSISNIEWVRGSAYSGDTLIGSTSNDSLDGASGTWGDSLVGGSGNDQLFGQQGNDSLFGGEGGDYLDGGDGDDLLHGGGGNDSFSGRTGADIFIISASTGQSIVIFDFETSASGEKLDIRSLPVYSLDDISISGTTNAVITLPDSQQITLYGVTASSLTASDFIFGTTGTDNADSITSSNANDFIEGFEGNDTLYGGAGNDTINGGAGADQLFGENGDDWLIADSADVTSGSVIGGSGNDTLEINGTTGISLNVVIAGIESALGSDSGNDSLNAGTATVAMILDGRGGNDTLNGGTVNDSILGGSGNDVLYGRAGNDTIDGGAGADYILGYEGDDVLYVDSDDITSSTIDGGSGNDTVYVTGSTGVSFNFNIYSIQIVYGSDGGNDSLNGVSATDIKELYGRQGNDTLGAGDEGDLVHGGQGNDVLLGRAGNDALYGGVGNDNLTGHEGNDLIYGNEGNDTLSGGDGNDTLYVDADDGSYDGGAGYDWLFVEGTVGRTVNLYTFGLERVHGGGGNDNLTALNSTTNVIIYGGDGNDTINGGNGDDAFRAGTGNDQILGRQGNDYIEAQQGADALLGYEGDDTLIGGDDVDTLTGGSGADLFDYVDAYASGIGSGNRDVITDFSQSDGDIIDLYSSFTFLGTTAFTGTDNEIRYVQSGGNTIVEIDNDADGITNMEIQLTGLYTLTGGDFA
jgi:Ca2+-binding RTX toxin-like protein